MVNYNNSKIYKIVDNTNNNIYVGSTTKKYLSDRLSSHNSDYRRFKKINKGYITSFEILKNNNFDIILLELVNCNSKDELKSRERFYIETLDCVNKNIPGRTNKEYKNVKYALERNWHNFSKDNSDQIEEQSKQLGNLTINIGLTPYLIYNFESSYGVQKNCVTGVKRVIRRGRSNFISKKLPQNLQDESCALCMEEFKDTPHIPTRETICKHTFHWTCLNNYKSREYTPLCPMCRHIL